MQVPNSPHNLKRSLFLFIAAGSFVMLLGVTVIAGWICNIDALRAIFPHYTAMKFNTAFCLILSAASFLLLLKYDTAFLKNLFRFTAVFLGCFAAFSYSQNLFNWSAGIDQLFITDNTPATPQLLIPGRMSPSADLSFILLALSFLGIDSKSLVYKKTAQYFLHLVTITALITIMGALLKVPYSSKFSFFSSMAITTAIAFFLLSLAASAINYNLGLTSIFTGTGIGNIIARKLFPRMIVILIILGYISIELERDGYINDAFGVVLSTISFLLICLFLVRDALNEMNHLDMKRTAAENETRILNRNLEDMVLQRTIDLKHSNDRFIKIFDSNPVCITISRLHTGEYVDVNPALLALLHYDRHEIIGHTSTELSIISDDYRKYMVDSLARWGYIKNEYIVLKDKYNDLKHCMLCAELLENNNEKFMMSFVYDITDLKMIEYNLKDAKKELEILTDKLTNQNKQLLSFAHITSHNLRSPVSNLNLLVHFYKESTSQEDKNDLWGNFETVVNHLNTTLNELLESLKIQEDTSKEREKLSFEKTFFGVKDILIGQILESKAIITTDFSKAPAIIYPKIYLESIILNLVSNAIKYRSPDRILKINMVTDIINNELIFTIQDNGLGIDMNRHKSNLFGLRKTFHRHAEAKGLGLFITKTQIEAMGGEISAESEVDKGSVFKIIFNKNKA